MAKTKEPIFTMVFHQLSEQSGYDRGVHQTNYLVLQRGGQVVCVTGSHHFAEWIVSAMNASLEKE